MKVIKLLKRAALGVFGAGACDIPMEPFKKSLIALYELITGEKA